MWLPWLKKNRSPRYCTSDVDFLTATFEPTSKALRLTNLSEGGCAFVGHVRDSKLKAKTQVVCTFYSDSGFKQTLIGHLVYARPLKDSGHSDYQYGIEFAEEDQFKINPIISRLKTMADARLIEIQ